MTSGQWIVDVACQGYRLEFTERPPPFRGVRHTPIPKDLGKMSALMKRSNSRNSRSGSDRFLFNLSF